MNNRAIPKTVEKIVEKFLLSKKGTVDGGDDRLILGPRFFGVVDGATDKGRLNWSKLSGEFQGGAATLAQIVKECFESAKASETVYGIVSDINASLQNAGSHLKQELAFKEHRPCASFAVLDLDERKIYTAGDCLVGLKYEDHHFDVIRPELEADKLLKEIRRRTILEILSKNEDPFAEGNDRGRDAIIHFLTVQGKLVNADPNDTQEWADGIPVGPYAITAVDGFTNILPTLIPIPAGVISIILATDGYPILKPSLSESEAELTELLKADPHRYLMSPSTKGRATGAASFDDRAFLEVNIERGA